MAINPKTAWNVMEPACFIELLAKDTVTIERLDVMSGRISLFKRFTPGSVSEYTSAESDVGAIYEVPAAGGSTWGTDGGSIGGMVGIKEGYMRLTRTGCQKRWLRKLEKLVAAGPVKA